MLTGFISKAFQVVEDQNPNLIDASKQAIRLYPNPNNEDKVYIRVAKPWEGKALMQVLDKQGNIYLNREVDSQELELDISSLRTGYYIIRWQTESGVFHTALIRN
ncbi:MAG: T9SS type A sorting domain-containing protein [Microscillaceae bacterium]|nr:T9SS type A sorting domain-containing protein [Microscillaceae bacterium]